MVDVSSKVGRLRLFLLRHLAQIIVPSKSYSFNNRTGSSVVECMIPVHKVAGSIPVRFNPQSLTHFTFLSFFASIFMGVDLYSENLRYMNFYA